MSHYNPKPPSVEEHLKRRLEFEECVAKISSRFVHTSDLNEAIQASLADVGQLSGAGRAYLFLLHEDGTALDNTHEWCAEGVSPQMANLQNLPSETFPWWMGILRAGEVIHVPDVSKMPKEATAERQILESQDIKSILVLPVLAGEKLLGFIGFDNVSTAGAWSQVDLAFLRMLSETIGTALERKQGEKALRESEHRFRELFENANDFIYTHDLQGNFVSVNPAAVRAYGYTSEEMLQLNIARIVDPQYLPLAQKMIRNKLSDTPSIGPYELLTRDKNGTPIWVEVNTRLFEQNGKPVGIHGIARNVTERKRAEKALQESEERFRLAFENANTGMCLVDMKGRLLKVNNRMCEIFGYSREDLESMTVNDIAHPEDIDASPTFMQRVLAGEIAGGTFEKRYFHKQGHIVYGLVSSSLIRDSQGTPLNFISQVQDITERKRAEAELQYRLKFERLIATLSTDFIHSAHGDLDRKVNEALKAIGEFVGVARSYVSLFDSDPTKMSITHEWCAQGIEPQIQYLQHVDIQPLAWSMERLGRLEVVHIPRVAELPPEASVERGLFESQNIRSLILVPMSYGESLMGFIGFDSVHAERTWSDENIALLKLVREMFVNALVRKQTEEKVIERNRELSILNTIAQTTTQSLDLDEIIEKALNNIMEVLHIKHAGVYTLDEKAEYLTLRVHHGIGDEIADTIPPMSLSDIGLAVSKPLFIASLPDLLSQIPDQTVGVVTENQLKSVMILPLTSKGKSLGVMFAATQNERIFTHEERELLTTIGHQVSTAIENVQLLKEASRSIALEETERLRTAFLASVSHELRTPLTCIKGLASSLILPDIEWDAETQRDFLTTIDRESDRLTRIVNDILDMSKIEIGAMRLSKSSMRIGDVIEGLRNVLKSLALNHDLRLRLAEDLPPVFADVVRIKQAISNLVENAISHSPQGSPIILETRLADKEIVVSVADQGEGIPPEDLDRVFSPFYRIEENTERRRSGVGLGLAICKGIVKSHDGRMWAESAGQGKGLTVYFTLPITNK